MEPTPPKVADLPLGELISLLYEHYLECYPGDPDKAAVVTAAAVNHVLASRTPSEDP